MGNAVISGILFQPPAPPMALPEVLGPNDKPSNNGTDGAQQNTPPIRKRSHNLSVNYLWLYSTDEYDEARLIPAIHIAHTDVGQAHPNGRYTLLYSHGNAEDLGLISSFLVDLARLLQVNVLCYDYSGYGVSADEASVETFFNAYQTQIEAWKVYRINGDDGVICARRGSENGCRYTRDLFVASFLRPPSSEAGTESAGATDPQGEDDDAASYFDNACSVTVADAANEDPAEKRRRTLLEKHAWRTPLPSEAHCYANVRSAYDFLTVVEGVRPNHVILYGKSVGSGPTCWLAQKLCQARVDGRSSRWDADSMCNGSGTDESREPAEGDERREAGGRGGRGSEAPGGVVLHSPFLSVIRVVLDVGFTTMGDLFPNIDRVGDFTCPAYVIHGSNDGIVPFYHGQTLFQNIPDTSKMVPFWARGAGHNNIEMDMPTAYVKRLQQFVRQCDRLNYPGRAAAGKMAKQQQQRQKMLQASVPRPGALDLSIRGASKMVGGRPTLHRYASQDSYHLAKTVGESPRPSKQRKQKGTLVMGGMRAHDQPQAVSLPPPPPSMRQQRSVGSDWDAASPTQQGTSIEELRNATARQEQLQQQRKYASGNPAASRYPRSMSTSAVSSGKAPLFNQSAVQQQSRVGIQRQQYSQARLHSSAETQRVL
ncbi:hypothetical protein ACHAXT_000100 [Thalassiosira profunda]